MSGVAPYHEAGRGAYFSALYDLVQQLLVKDRDITNQDVTRPSLWVGSPDRKKFLYVGLHGFYRVTTSVEFNRMARILTNHLPMRGGDNKTAWKRHLQVAFIIAIASFVTNAVTVGCPGLRDTTLTCSMAWDISKWSDYYRQQMAGISDGRLAMLEIFKLKRGFEVIEKAEWNTMSAWALDTLEKNAHTQKVSEENFYRKWPMELKMAEIKT
jgi:hypothetical protein